MTLLPTSLSLSQVRALRLGLGVAICFIIAVSINWQLAYLTPVLLSKLLSSPKKPISAKAGMGLLIIILLSFFPFLILGQIAIVQPAVAIALSLLGFFYIFYANALGKLNPIITIMMLIGITVLPLMTLTKPELSWWFTSGFIFSAGMAIVFALICFWLMPDPADTHYPAPAEPQSNTEKLLAQIQAGISTLVVFPLALYFYATNALSEALIIVFVAILMQNTDLASNIKAGIGLVVTNILGGVVALAIFTILAAAPTLPIFTLIMMAGCLLVAQQMYSDSKLAPFFAAGFSTTLVLLGSITTSAGGDFNEKFFTRIIQITLASSYVVLGIIMVKGLFAHKRDALLAKLNQHKA